MKQIRIKYDYYKTFLILYWTGILTTSIIIMTLIQINKELNLILTMIDVFLFIGFVYFFSKFREQYKILIIESKKTYKKTKKREKKLR